MSIKAKDSGLKFLLVSLLIVILDQYTKYLVVEHVPAYTAGIAVTSFFSIVHVYNEGAAFSFLASMGGWQRYLFMGIATVISLVLIIALRRTSKHKPYTCLGIALLLGGAVGNLLDRVFLGHVVDFLMFYLKGDDWFWSYPSFNVADIGVCCGAALLVLIGFFGKDPKKEDHNKDSSCQDKSSKKSSSQEHSTEHGAQS